MTATLAIRHELLLPASTRDVWRAISTADGMTGWFCANAELGDEPGATLAVSWGRERPFPIARIETRDVERCLVLRDIGPDGNDGGRTIRFELRPEGDQTRLALAHEGWDPDQLGDDRWDSTDRGWRIMLVNLRDFVASDRRHQPFTQGWTTSTRMVAATIWSAFLRGAEPRFGERLVLQVDANRRIEGTVDICNTGRALGIRLDSHGGALLRLEIAANSDTRDVTLLLFGNEADREALSALFDTLTSRMRALLT